MLDDTNYMGRHDVINAERISFIMAQQSEVKLASKTTVAVIYEVQLQEKLILIS